MICEQCLHKRFHKFHFTRAQVTCWWRY